MEPDPTGPLIEHTTPLGSLAWIHRKAEPSGGARSPASRPTSSLLRPAKQISAGRGLRHKGLCPVEMPGRRLALVGAQQPDQDCGGNDQAEHQDGLERIDVIEAV
jgi:hypothetical protein